MIWRVTLRCVGMSVGVVFCWEDVDWEDAAWLYPSCAEGMPREGEKVAVERAGRPRNAGTIRSGWAAGQELSHRETNTRDNQIAFVLL